MVDSKGNASVPARGNMDDIVRGNLADRDSERRTENGDMGAEHGQNSQPIKPSGKKPGGKKK